MKNKILIDASHSEETRVVVLNNGEIDEYEFEVTSKKELKGNIYLAKVTKVEASLQAAFVDYGAKKQGFLPFSEINVHYFNISKEALNDIKIKQMEYKESIKAKFRKNKEAAKAKLNDANGFDKSKNPNNRDNKNPHNNNTTKDHSSTVVEENINHINNAYNNEEVINNDLKSEDALDDQNLNNTAVSNNISNEHAAINQIEEQEDDDNFIIDDEELLLQMEKENLSYGSRFGHKIQDVIKTNQYILVQVVKEERGNKGAFLTTYISIPGKYCVLMPNSYFEGGISKKISNPQDRQRLKKIISSLNIPENTNVIMRTACLDKSDEQIIQDYNYISNVWENIQKQLINTKKIGLLFEDGALIKKVIRDLYSGDIEEIVIEGGKAHESALNFAKSIAPDIIKKIKKFHHQKLNIFKYYNVEEMVKNIYSPVVFLRSGGYIVINPTEALIAIDVNSGKSKGKRNVEETAIKTNMEAVVEIMQQIKLRDIGGLIVIDFIDMENPKNRIMIEKKVRELAKFDKAKLQVNPISSFGLLEISRQRIKASILERSFHVCPKCQGVGYIKPLELSSLYILKNLENELHNHKIHATSDFIVIKMPSAESFYLLNNKRLELNKLEHSIKTNIRIECDDTLPYPFYSIEEPKQEDENETVFFLEKELENNREAIKANKKVMPNSNNYNKKEHYSQRNKNNKHPHKKQESWLSKLLKFKYL